MSARTPPCANVRLVEVTRADRDRVGSKVANLGELLRAGFPVPDGVVVLDELDSDPNEILHLLGDVPVAVRSSAAAEDLAAASFAGQYETILNVSGPGALRDAIRQVRASAASARAQHYAVARGLSSEGGIAVLVQRMLAPEAAGVAFTADPVTGRRDEVVITAACGLGERVVSGEAVGDEWVVRNGAAVCRRSVEAAITRAQALEIAALARRVEAYFDGVPQDVEWASEGSRVYLLQARPITALPDQVDWTPPEPGYWLRTFRLGEWLSDPMTPLFHEWLLILLEAGLLAGMRETTGTAIAFPRANINGWYYTMAGPRPRSIPGELARAFVESRGRVLPVLFNALVLVNMRPDLSDRALLRGLAEQWRHDLLPHYQQLITAGEGTVETATPAQLIDLVDAVGCSAGTYFWSLAIVGGSAWKMEGCLARFVRKHLSAVAGANVQVLLRGLPGITLGTPPHAVESIDWYFPTLGQQGGQATAVERRARLVTEREAAEAACRRALATRPAVCARFDSLLEVAQRYATIREEQARLFTLGWPLLRRAVLRLGDGVRASGALDRADDVFFLSRAEVEHPAADMRDTVQLRRDEWQRQRRLVAPLEIGQGPRVLRALLSGVAPVVHRTNVSGDALVGQGASPGRATGHVRLVHSVADFDAFKPGEVLVARATAPAWTPLFERAAAVVTDSGTLAAHASLVAREYGIPAVVGTGEASRRLRTGQVVTVDGSTGTVEIARG
jgi:phosphohistidine swiveling domain-containing protein